MPGCIGHFAKQNKLTNRLLMYLVTINNFSRSGFDFIAIWIDRAEFGLCKIRGFNITGVLGWFGAKPLVQMQNRCRLWTQCQPPSQGSVCVARNQTIATPTLDCLWKLAIQKCHPPITVPELDPSPAPLDRHLLHPCCIYFLIFTSSTTSSKVISGEII